ncbi:MAG: hypothetical protein ACKODX_07410 [Gemmata sp.]
MKNCANVMGVLCVLAALGGGSPGRATADEPANYEKHADIAYRADAGADEERHKLDVYAPKGNLVRCKDRDHITIIVLFVNRTDLLNKSFREFVEKHSK